MPQQCSRSQAAALPLTYIARAPHDVVCQALTVVKWGVCSRPSHGQSSAPWRNFEKLNAPSRSTLCPLSLFQISSKSDKLENFRLRPERRAIGVNAPQKRGVVWGRSQRREGGVRSRLPDEISQRNLVRLNTSHHLPRLQNFSRIGQTLIFHRWTQRRAIGGKPLQRRGLAARWIGRRRGVVRLRLMAKISS